MVDWWLFLIPIGFFSLGGYGIFLFLSEWRKINAKSSATLPIEGKA